MKISKEVTIFLLFLILYALITKTFVLENDASRMAAIESLVEKGSFIIDNATTMPGVDKILVDGHLYSSKPPMLSLVGALPYAVIHNVLGLSFRQNTAICIYLLTLLTIGTTSSLLVVSFYRSLRFIGVNERQKNFLAFLLGIGTLLFTYSGVFNSHTISSFFIFYSFFLLLKVRFEGKNVPLNLFVSGLSAGIAGGIEPPLYIAFMAFIPIILKSTKKENVIPYLIGGLITVILYALMNYAILNSILPLHLQPNKKEYYSQESWESFMNEYVPRREYLFNSLLGYQGFFSHTPILLLGLYSMIKAAGNRKHKFVLESRIILTTFILIYLYYLLSGHNYGGASVGLRRMINLTPFFVFSLAIMLKEKLSHRLTMFLIATAVVSVTIAVSLSISPWSVETPRFFYTLFFISTLIGLLPLTSEASLNFVRRYVGMGVK